MMVYFIPLAHILARENKKKVFFFYTEIKYCIELTKSARRVLSIFLYDIHVYPTGQLCFLGIQTRLKACAYYTEKVQVTCWIFHGIP